MLIKSVATSYILKILFDSFCECKNIIFSNKTNYTITLILTSAFLGLIIGKITTHRQFNLLLHKLHIGRTTNTNIWDDAIKPYTWVRVFMNDGSSYMGQYRFGEPFKSEPIIVLATYQKLNKDIDVVIDNTQKPNELIMLNTKDFDRIEIIYVDPPERSNKIRERLVRWKQRIKKEETKQSSTTTTATTK